MSALSDDDVNPNGHLREAHGQPQVLIPENDHGVPEGWQNVVHLLRTFADKPDAVRFIADMIEC